MTGDQARVTALSTVHFVRVAFWIGVQAGAEATGRRAAAVAGVAEQRAEKDLERVTGMAG